MLKKKTQVNKKSRLNIFQRIIRLITKPRLEIRVGIRTRMSSPLRVRYDFWKSSRRKITLIFFFFIFSFLYVHDMGEFHSAFVVYGEYKHMQAINKEFEDYMKEYMKQFEGFY